MTAPSRDWMGRLLQDSTLYLIGNLAGRALGFLAIPFYARFLSPTEYGIIELVELSTQSVAIAFGLQSIGAALSRLFHDEATPAGERTVVSTGLISTAVLSAAVTIPFVFAAGPLGRLVLHSGQWTGLLQAAFVAMFLSNMVEVELVYERIQNRARFFLIYSLIVLAANLSLNVLFIGVFHFGVWGFVASKLCVTSVSCTFLLVRAWREVGWRFKGALLPGFIRFGAPLIVSSLAYFLIHFSDRFFLTGTVSLAELGRYALAYRFAMLISVLVGDSFNKSWSVTFYRYVKQPGWQDLFARVAKFLTFVLCGTALGVTLFGPEALRLMVPPDFYPAPLLLPLLVLAYVFRELGDFFRNLLLINKRTILVGKVAGASGVLTVVLNLVLIPRFGVFGAAGATALTWLAYLAACWIIAHREHRVPIRPSSYALILGLGGGIFALASVLRVASWPLQVLADGGWMLLFAVLCLPLYFNREERALMASAAGALRARLGVRGSGAAWVTDLRSVSWCTLSCCPWSPASQHQGPAVLAVHGYEAAWRDPIAPAALTSSRPAHKGICLVLLLIIRAECTAAQAPVGYVSPVIAHPINQRRGGGLDKQVFNSARIRLSFYRCLPGAPDQDAVMCYVSHYLSPV